MEDVPSPEFRRPGTRTWHKDTVKPSTLRSSPLSLDRLAEDIGAYHSNSTVSIGRTLLNPPEIGQMVMQLQASAESFRLKFSALWGTVALRYTNTMKYSLATQMLKDIGGLDGYRSDFSDADMHCSVAGMEIFQNSQKLRVSLALSGAAIPSLVRERDLVSSFADRWSRIGNTTQLSLITVDGIGAEMRDFTRETSELRGVVSGIALEFGRLDVVRYAA